MSSKPKAIKSKRKTRKDKGSSSPVARKQISSLTAGLGLIYIEFEIRGKVKGVHFRKYTQAKAKELGLRGWVQNTTHGTVIGCMEGAKLNIDLMKDWLRRTGSPKSKILATEFKNIKLIPEYTLEDFMVIK